MIIKAIKETLGQVFHSPEASGTWTDDDIECAIDDNIVECSEMEKEPYVGVPAPAVLPDDEWFGPSPVHTEKQEEYIRQQEATERLHQDMRNESGSVESEDIHQVMYEMSTSHWNTVQESQGGSENFQGGSENVQR